MSANGVGVVQDESDRPEFPYVNIDWCEHCGGRVCRRPSDGWGARWFHALAIPGPFEIHQALPRSSWPF